MDIADEIERLNDLRERGVMSEEEFQAAKASVLAGESAGADSGAGKSDWTGAMENISSDVNMWSMFIHLSQFCGYIIPMAGLIVPIVLWQVKKDESEVIDRHGRVVVNWILSQLIYAFVSGLLCMIVIGIPLLLALVAVGIIFPIIGALKANSGELWPYPLSIRFFRID